jgi:lipoprotein-anchoring transpeptidase ErfK/SrfK
MRIGTGIVGGLIVTAAAAVMAQTPVPPAKPAPAPAPPKPAAAPAKPAPAAAAPAAPSASTIDPKVMQVQVILDHLGFSPGVIDGQSGASLKRAVSGFQSARDLPVSGAIDPKTADALNQFKTTGGPVADVTLTAADLAGPFVGPIPKKEDAQAKLPSLGYSNPLEMLSERYHTTPATLIAMNSPDTKLAPGTVIHVPNVLNDTRDYPAPLPEAYKQTLAGLNIGSQQPQAAKLVVSKAGKTLSVYDDAGKLVAQFPVTTGSSHDPLPIGTWKILGLDYNPKFHFNPKLFWDAKPGEKAAMLPPGPNGPVGVVWMDLSKPHYGIHGTPVPENIGRTASHGCVRMTNWDAARVSLMVKPGTPAIFQP